MRNFGTVKYKAKSNSWEIITEPHISIKMKRFFAQVDSNRMGKIVMAANATNSMELEWFLKMYPHEVTPAELLSELANGFRERQTVLESLLQGKSTGAPPPALKRPARDYQVIASELWHNLHGYLLADDVGAGKTVSCLAGLMDPRTLPALIVVKAHLPDQWMEKITEFTPLTAHKIRKATPYDITKFHDGVMPDILVMNYHKLSGWAETLATVLKSVTFDEIQELRHTGTAKYSAAQHICKAVDYRLGLSATPIYNYGDEIWNISNLLSPGALGTFDEFRREWCKVYGDKVKITNPQAFGLYMRDAGLMLRRTRKDIGRELPPVTVVTQHIDADPKVLATVQGEAIELAKLILRQKQDFKGQKMMAAGEFDMRMRMATGVAKAPYVADFVKLLCDDNDIKVILFGWHREVYEIWLQELAHLNPVMFTGSESPAQKEASRQAFIHGDAKLLIVSLRSGDGVDGLQDVCSTVVFGELDWSDSVHQQGIGRVNRDRSDGSPCNPALAYYLISDHGSDPIMVDILGIKREQAQGVIDPYREIVLPVEVDPEHVRKLALNYLQQHGVEIPSEEEVQVLSTQESAYVPEV